MENKESYTPKELEKIMILYREYSESKKNAKINEMKGDESLYQMNKKILNDTVSEIKRNIPKSLMNKLEIKKIR